MADKEVISTVTGSQLGVLSDLLVDSTTMTVAALCLGQKTWGRKGMAGSCLELAAMVQVGDVVLVNQDAPWPRTYAQTFQKLRGCQVYTYNGIPLGKVMLLGLPSLVQSSQSPACRGPASLSQLAERLLLHSTAVWVWKQRCWLWEADKPGACRSGTSPSTLTRAV